jgi:hypothetical protein
LTSCDSNCEQNDRYMDEASSFLNLDNPCTGLSTQVSYLSIVCRRQLSPEDLTRAECKQTPTRVNNVEAGNHHYPRCRQLGQNRTRSSPGPYVVSLTGASLSQLLTVTRRLGRRSVRVIEQTFALRTYGRCRIGANSDEPQIPARPTKGGLPLPGEERWEIRRALHRQETSQAQRNKISEHRSRYCRRVGCRPAIKKQCCRC